MRSPGLRVRAPRRKDSQTLCCSPLTALGPIAGVGRRAAHYLVTFLYPTRLASDARWRAGVRPTLGPLRPLLSLAPRPPFHRTRTVAGAAPRARLDKDGSPWRRSPLVSMYRRTASMLPCVQVVKILPCRALVPGSTTS